MCWSWNEHIYKERIESNAPYRFQPCFVLLWCEARQRKRRPVTITRTVWTVRQINSTTRNACGCRMYVVTKKHGNPTQKLKWFPRDKTMLVTVQASLNISKPERGHFFPVRRLLLRIWDVVLYMRRSRLPWLLVIVICIARWRFGRQKADANRVRFVQ